jgi:TolB-like protein/Tfp pilus assembly protein PilF
MAGHWFLVRELRRRRVFRNIGYYLVGAWTLLQVAELIAEPAGLPAWTLTALLYLAVVGFPLAVWVAWRYELTDHGLVRTRSASAADSGADYSLKPSDYVIFAAMLVVIGAIAWQGLANIRSEAEETQARVEEAAETEREAVENSVAVLPFADLSQNADQAYLSEGLSDTVLHVLSQVKGLTVSARTSSFAYRDRGMTTAEIGRELGVAHILEGSLQRAGDQLRIIARLIDARTSRELWSGNFDRELKEIFAIQDEIAREVVVAMQVTVLEDDRERIENKYRPDLEAYEQYVMGRRELDLGTVASLESAEQRFKQAIEIDPGYALAYTALARTYRLMSLFGDRSSLAELRAKEEPLIEKALDLDPTLAEAWESQAGLQMEDKEFEKAEHSIRRALELNPNSADAWAGYWNLLLFGNQQEEALAAIRKAAELDPESNRIQISLAQQLFRLSRAEEAIYVLRENIRRHPDSPRSYEILARYLNQAGRPGEAMWYLQTMRRRDPDNMGTWFAVCQQHWQLWDSASASQCLERYLQANPDDLEAHSWAASVRDDMEEFTRIAELKVAQHPQLWYPKMQLADGLSELGEWDRIVETVTSAFPALTEPQPTINDFNQWGARRLAEALIKTGQVDRGLLLADLSIEWFERSRKFQAGGWTAGTEDALLYAIKGDNERALDILERAVNRDWMFYAQAILSDSAFKHLWDDSRYLALIDRLEQKMAREREWYEVHKDDLQL